MVGDAAGRAGTADIQSGASGTSCAVSSGIGSGTGRNERQYGNELELLDVPADAE